jgi:hypothetical protein
MAADSLFQAGVDSLPRIGSRKAVHLPYYLTFDVIRKPLINDAEIPFISELASILNNRC